DALRAAVTAWDVGSRRPEEEDAPARDQHPLLDALAAGRHVEAALLDRTTRRESKFRLLTADELKPYLPT
ncbi:MAG: hypothetical protein C4321_08165, partial [Chloroflexota bacterium]